MNIKKLREWRGLSQERVAQELELSRTTYTKYENGVHDPSLKTLVNISKYFDVPVDYIAGGTFCSVEDLGSRLRDCREAQGSAVRDAAALLDVSEELYEAFENGEAEPTLAMLSKLAQTYQTSPEYLLGISAPDSEEFGALLTEEERRLITLFRQADPRDKAVIWAVLSKYLRPEKPQEETASPQEARREARKNEPAPRDEARERAAARRDIPPREPPVRQKPAAPRQVALPTRDAEPRREPDSRPRPVLPTRQPPVQERSVPGRAPVQGHSAPPLPQRPQPASGAAGQGAMYERIRTAFKNGGQN